VWIVIWDEKVLVKHATDKALLIVYEGHEAWIPTSQISDDSEVWGREHVGQEGRLVIPNWLAEAKGLEG